MYKYIIKAKKISKVLSENFSGTNIPKKLFLKSSKPLSNEKIFSKVRNYFKNQYGIVVESLDISGQNHPQKVTLPVLLGRVRQFFISEINRRGELYDNFKLWVDENKNDFGRKLIHLQAKDVYVKYLMRRLKDSLEKSDENSFASDFDFICDKIKSLKISPERKAERLEEKLGNPFGFDEIYDWEPVLFAFGRLGFDLNLFRNMNITDGQKLVLAYHFIGADKELTYDEIDRLLF